jgi:hypothetical protein
VWPANGHSPLPETARLAEDCLTARAAQSPLVMSQFEFELPTRKRALTEGRSSR